MNSSLLLQNNRRTWTNYIPSLSEDPTHPTQIAIRTYALALSLSLGPSLISLITSFLAFKDSSRISISALKRVLRRELGHDGFAFSVTLSAGGGAVMRQLWRILDEFFKSEDSATLPVPPEGSKPSVRGVWRQFRVWTQRLNITPVQKTFISNVLSSSIGILLLQAGAQRAYRLRRTSAPAGILPLTPPPPVSRPSLASPTLDLTILLLVRAVDAILQTFLLRRIELTRPESHQNYGTFVGPPGVREKLLKEKARRKSDGLKKLISRIDAFVFWACSARIMWCFFYEPERLPRSYVKWINTLANLDPRILQTLRLIRENRWSYIRGSPYHTHVLTTFAEDIGHNASWGDPLALPAYGGAVADAAWQTLGVKDRSGLGGLPCELVHGGVGSSFGLASSCTTNSSIRCAKAFIEAVAIYLPVHFLPVLLTQPQTLLQPHRAFATLFGALRSAAFLSSFVGFYWYAVCLTRSLVFARLFFFISHDFWDGPFGCILAGCLACGSSIWIENGRRRGEMALYVLPRALRACLPDAWVKSGHRGVRFAERLAFVFSISTLLTAGIHRPDSLRGLSRWTLAFVINGPNAGFWKRKRRNPSIPPTPSIPSTPMGQESVPA